MLEATLAGYKIDIDSISDGLEKSVAQYEFPFVDGAKTDDMGMKARVISFTAYFFNDRYEEHTYLLSYIQSNELVELVHPLYGTMNGRCRSIKVQHDDRELTAELSIEFVEELYAPIFVSPSGDITQKALASYWVSAYGSSESFIESLVQTLSDARSFVRTPLTKGVSFASQITGISNAALSLINSLDEYSSAVDSYASAIESTDDAAVSVVTFPITLPGIIAEKTFQATSRIAISVTTAFADSSPAALLRNMKSALNQFSNTFKSNVSGTYPIVCAAVASTLVFETSKILTSDTSSRANRTQSNKTSSFDILGNRLSSSNADKPMTRNELELVVWNACDAINYALSIDRSIPGLMEQAAMLNGYLREVAVKYALLVEKEYLTDLPLHLICLIEGLPYNDAELILEVNPTIKDPQSVSGTILIPVMGK
jgi:prophage DNA circulation protein